MLEESERTRFTTIQSKFDDELGNWFGICFYSNADEFRSNFLSANTGHGKRIEFREFRPAVRIVPLEVSLIRSTFSRCYAYAGVRQGHEEKVFSFKHYLL